MAKIEKIGNGWIKIEGILINLASLKEVSKESFGYDEDPDDENTCSIKIIPVTPSEDDKSSGSDGSYHIPYKEERDRDADFEVIEQTLKGN